MNSIVTTHNGTTNDKMLILKTKSILSLDYTMNKEMQYLTTNLT